MERNIGHFWNYRAIQDWWKFWRKSTAGNFSRRWTPWRTWWPPSELTRLCTQLSRLWSTQAMRLVTNERTNKQTKQTHVKQRTKDKTTKKQASLKTNRKQTRKQRIKKQTSKPYVVIVIFINMTVCMKNVYCCSSGNPSRAVLRAVQGCGWTSGGNGALCSLNSSK